MVPLICLLDLRSLERDATNAAAGEARPLGIAWYSTITDPAVEGSYVGAEQTTQPAPTIQQLQELVVKLSRLGSLLTVSRQPPISQCLLV